jgi:DNA-binding NarL/FixJ family response regulator
VQPLSLCRVVQLILSGASEVKVLAHPLTHSDDAENLRRQAKRVQPDLLIANAELLGADACAAVMNIKRTCPRTRIILTDFDARLDAMANRCGADAYLEEELLVRKLLATVRRLAAKSNSRRTRARRRASVPRPRLTRGRRAG